MDAVLADGAVLWSALLVMAYAGVIAISVFSAWLSVRFWLRFRDGVATKQDRRRSVGWAAYACVVLLFLQVMRTAAATPSFGGLAAHGVPALMTAAGFLAVAGLFAVVGAIFLAAVLALITTGPYRHTVADDDSRPGQVPLRAVRNGDLRRGR